MNIKAAAKNVRISPRKVGVVASLVRGRSVEDALVILEHTPRRSAKPVEKLIKSVQANGENNHNIKPGTMRLSKITVTPGPRMKRYRPAAHGRALPFERKSSHIFIEAEGEVRAPKKPVADKTEAKTEKPKPAKKEAK